MSLLIELEAAIAARRDHHELRGTDRPHPAAMVVLLMEALGAAAALVPVARIQRERAADRHARLLAFRRQLLTLAADAVLAVGALDASDLAAYHEAERARRAQAESGGR